MKKCQHKNLGGVEVIKAYHYTNYDQDGEVWFNCEPGGLVKNLVVCYDCDKEWVVTKTSPKFIKEFHKKVENDRSQSM